MKRVGIALRGNDATILGADDDTAAGAAEAAHALVPLDAVTLTGGRRLRCWP